MATQPGATVTTPKLTRLVPPVTPEKHSFQQTCRRSADGQVPLGVPSPHSYKYRTTAALDNTVVANRYQISAGSCSRSCILIIRAAAASRLSLRSSLPDAPTRKLRTPTAKSLLLPRVEYSPSFLYLLTYSGIISKPFQR